MLKRSGWVLAFALSALAVGSACTKSAPTPATHGEHEEFGSLSVDEVDALRQKGEASIFDNNSADHYAQGHVPGAKWLKYDAVTAADLPADKSRTLVFYCANEH